MQSAVQGLIQNSVQEILAIIAINITYGLDPYIMNTSKNSIKLKITET